jgi:hypothetical protein
MAFLHIILDRKGGREPLVSRDMLFGSRASEGLVVEVVRIHPCQKRAS